MFGEVDAGESRGALNQKALARWELSPTALGVALKASLKLPSYPPTNARNADEWEPYLAEKRTEIKCRSLDSL